MKQYITLFHTRREAVHYLVCRQHNSQEAASQIGPQQCLQKDMFVGDYTSQIKEIRDTLVSINVTVDEDEMVQVYLGGLASKFGAFRTMVCTRVICHLSSSYSRCCSLKKTTWVRQQAHTPTTRCCTWRGTGPLNIPPQGQVGDQLCVPWSMCFAGSHSVLPVLALARFLHAALSLQLPFHSSGLYMIWLV